MSCGTIANSNVNKNCPLICHLSSTDTNDANTLSTTIGNAAVGSPVTCPTQAQYVTCTPMTLDDVKKKYGNTNAGGFFASPYNQTCGGGDESVVGGLIFPPNAASDGLQTDSDTFFNCLNQDVTNLDNLCEWIKSQAIDTNTPCLYNQWTDWGQCKNGSQIRDRLVKAGTKDRCTDTTQTQSCGPHKQPSNPPGPHGHKQPSNPTLSPHPPHPPNKTGHGSNTGLYTGLGVGVLIILIAFSIYLYRRSRRRTTS
jgi:LPXTG-motif cell wall-anchored protein